MSRLSIAGVVGLVLGAAPAAEPPQAPAPRPVDVAALVRQLGGGDFAEREAAVRRLSTLKVDEVPPELLAALREDDPEVRERAARAAGALREHIALMRLPRGDRFAKQGRVDLYVASTAAGGTGAKDDDDRLWEPALGAGRRLVARAEMKGDRMPRGCPALCDDYPTFRKAYPGLRFVRTDGLYAPPDGYVRRYHRMIRAAGVAESESLLGLVVSRGPVATKGHVYEAVLLATGDVESGDNISGSVVVCDGDVRVRGGVLKSLVIARGDITVRGQTDTCTLIAGGTVTLDYPLPAPPEPVADPELNRQRQRDAETYGTHVKEKVARPLGYVTFFELSAVGVGVEAADKVVRVTAVEDSGAFAAAGVRVGDVVTAVNGKKPDTAESLRRLLRDALALGDATVTLRRGDTNVTVKVSLPE